MQETRLKWFEHVKMRSTHAPVRRCGRLTVIGLKRGEVDRGRIERKIIRHDMT